MDLLLELLSEEIPARMQERACADLARLFADEIGKAGLKAEAYETYATPRRLALIARGLPEATAAVQEETKGPRSSAPPQALEGFLRKTGLAREQLVERDGVFFAVVDKPGRATAAVLAEAVPAVIRAFPWPKSMRWGAASALPTSLRWVRPLHGIVALFGDDVVPFAVEGIESGALTVGHRFHHPGGITIGNADDYVAKLRACHVVVDQRERQALIRERATELAAEAGLSLVSDEGLVVENAGLTEWPVPLLGRFDPAFLEVPREVIQLTMRTNQKYFACTDREGRLAPNFICTANIEAADGGAAIVAGNAKVLAARLSDARFFWQQDLKVPLAEQAKKLDRIVFHEKLGTVADKVERVAKLARWLVEEGIVGSEPSPSRERASLADMAEQAAHLCKADLVTGMVGEFPELQGIIGGYYARAEGYPDEVADAICDHYKPVGQGDEVPTAPVTVAVSLADKLDTIFEFFATNEKPTGSKDPFALRRSAVGVLAALLGNKARLNLEVWFVAQAGRSLWSAYDRAQRGAVRRREEALGRDLSAQEIAMLAVQVFPSRYGDPTEDLDALEICISEAITTAEDCLDQAAARDIDRHMVGVIEHLDELRDFLIDRLKVQQREAGVRHDLIDAVFALGGEDDLVRLLARVKALQAFVASEDGANLLTGYRRAANIVRIERAKDGTSTPAVIPAEAGIHGQGNVAGPGDTASMDSRLRGNDGSGDASAALPYAPEPAESALIAALDAAEPEAAAAVAREDFEGAMAALARLRPAVDAFFDDVTVNDPDPVKRAARLGLLDRIRVAMHNVADFSKIEG